MMTDPEILVLDEPTSGLDPNQIVEIRRIIKQIGKEKTIILSTHILSEAEATCDRVVIINGGKIVADGSTESLKASAGDKKHIHLTLQNADFKSVDKMLSNLEGISGVARIAESDSQLDVRLDCGSSFDPRAAIYQEIKQTDWIVLNFHQETQTLETIFRELTMEDA
jgi:ABC-2 type transport system ATP-binding protein